MIKQVVIDGKIEFITTQKYNRLIEQGKKVTVISNKDL